MSDKSIHSDFIKNRSIILSAFFNSGFLFFVFLTGVALYLSISYKDNLQFSNLMAIIGSLFGGFAGAFFKDEYDRASGKNILEKKGLSALRNLQGVSKQLRDIRVWIVHFLKIKEKKEYKRALEEINRHISTAEFSINSGLEDWGDIVPGLKEKIQDREKERKEIKEVDKKYKKVRQSVMVELLDKRKELVVAKNKEVEKELKEKINDLEKQIKEITKERSQIVHGTPLTASSLGDYDINSYLFDPNSNTVTVGVKSKKCSSCGKSFIPNISAYPYSLYNQDYCDKCKKKMGDDGLTTYINIKK